MSRGFGLTKDCISEIARLWTEEKMTPLMISGATGRSYETICKIVRQLPDNGTRGAQDKPKGWTKPTDTMEERMRGRRF